MALLHALGSGLRRSDEYIATGPIDAFDTGSYRQVISYTAEKPLKTLPQKCHRNVRIRVT